MKNASYLTQGHDPVLAAQIARTQPGMAHWALTGPLDRTCADCEHLGYQRPVRGAKIKMRGHGGRAKFLALTGSHGPVVPKCAEACRHFMPRTNDGE